MKRLPFFVFLAGSTMLLMDYWLLAQDRFWDMTLATMIIYSQQFTQHYGVMLAVIIWVAPFFAGLFCLVTQNLKERR